MRQKWRHVPPPSPRKEKVSSCGPVEPASDMVRSGAHMHVAWIEDDQAFIDAAAGWLTAQGYTFRHYLTGSTFEAERQEHADLILLDWQLPDMRGLDILRRLRERDHGLTPVIVVTMRDSEEDVVAALAAGCDDFLVKPVRRLELLARIDAVLRRRAPRSTADEMAFPPYRFKRSTREVFRHGTRIALSEREYRLALYLFENAGRAIARREIAEVAMGLDSATTSRTIDTHMSRLRRALALQPENGYRIAPIYGYGYRLEASA
jgi:two-component system, OmpR family, response regulator RegX3